MKIWIITPGRLPVPASRGGAVETLIQSLLDYNEIYTKYDVHVVTIFDDMAKQCSYQYHYTTFHFIKRSRVEEYLSEHHLLPYRLLDVFYSLKVIPVLKEYDLSSEIIIIENELVNGKILEKSIDANYVYHAHNILETVKKRPEIQFLNQCIKVITISDFVKQSIKRERIGKKTETVYNGVNVEMFKKISEKKRMKLREKYGIAEQDTVVVYAGRLIQEKGIDVLIEAFMKLPEHICVKLLIVGSSFFEKSKESIFIQKLKNMCISREKQILFTGYVRYEDMPKFYSIADIGCIPSLWEEPFGLTVIEQMAMELPIITTDAGAIPEIVDNTCAFMFERNEMLSSNIASAILTLCKQTDMQKNMGKAGRAIVSERFSEKIFCENWFKTICLEG